jgi:hypothetical protein
MLGEGVATEKHDGTACRVLDGRLWKRFDRKKGKGAPPEWEPCEDAADPNTGHWPGWLLVGEGPEDRYHREGMGNTSEAADGTYELVGPKVQGNPYALKSHYLWRHGFYHLDPPRTFEGLRAWFADHNLEGIVWHHADGRMVKIKRRDFGLPWPPIASAPPSGGRKGR